MSSAVLGRLSGGWKPSNPFQHPHNQLDTHHFSALSNKILSHPPSPDYPDLDYALPPTAQHLFSSYLDDPPPLSSSSQQKQSHGNTGWLTVCVECWPWKILSGVVIALVIILVTFSVYPIVGVAQDNAIQDTVSKMTDPAFLSSVHHYIADVSKVIHAIQNATTNPEGEQ